MGRNKKNRPFDHKSGAFSDGFKIGEKAALSKVREFIMKASRDELPFEVIQQTMDYIESQLRYGK